MILACKIKVLSHKSLGNLWSQPSRSSRLYTNNPNTLASPQPPNSTPIPQVWLTNSPFQASTLLGASALVLLPGEPLPQIPLWLLHVSTQINATLSAGPPWTPLNCSFPPCLFFCSAASHTCMAFWQGVQVIFTIIVCLSPVRTSPSQPTNVCLFRLLTSLTLPQGPPVEGTVNHL